MILGSDPSGSLMMTYILFRNIPGNDIQFQDMIVNMKKELLVVEMVQMISIIQE